MELQTTGDRLKNIRDIFKMNQTELANDLGVAQSQISAYEKNTYDISDQCKKLLLEKHKVNLNWLITGVGEMFIENTVYVQGQNKIRKIDLKFDNEQIIYIDVLENKLSAGPGQEDLERKVIGQIPILESFIYPYKPEQVDSVRVSGDSMIDEGLTNHDMVFFIKGLIEDNGLYAINYRNNNFIKRLEWDKFNKKITIKSANKKYNYEDIILKEGDENLIILGKVRCWMHNHFY